ncbi:hypothetical protein [Runella sp. SP2]|uniref:hypothetical protein n=1 Tax=Runella sp. SP2 TaxID=2268026 RepID=UPI000F082C5D|nr:hypothetical protein [Runella sp. SP2]AYQ32102.1 hypothetical protein DTQ70_07895 [Runella sp. SP2]
MNHQPNNQINHISLCKQLIEAKLQWGDGENWQNQDFENLSQQIFDETKLLVSSSTLKRIWGKVKYENQPKLNTLNALAAFLGYVSWREFENQNAAITPAQNPEKPADRNTHESQISKNHILLFGLLTTFIGMVFVGWSYFSPPKTIQFNHVVFKSKSVVKGVPTTIIFDYDVVDSNADSVFIQQSWDINQRAKVEKSGHTYTCTYYEPGYHKAKLILNDSVVAQHDLLIETPNWLATIDKFPIPIYVENIGNTLPLSITEKQLKIHRISFQKEVPWVSFYKISKNMCVPSQTFEMKTTLRNTSTESNGVCRISTITLLCQNGIIHIPLSIRGCVGELNLVVGSKKINGKTTDLSAFGVNFDKHVQVDCRVKNQLLSIFLDQHLIYQTPFKENLGNIVGSRISFKGTGELKDFELKKL